MNAPTLWEEGTLPISRALGLALLVYVPVVAAIVLITDNLGVFFGIGFVVASVFVALAVRPMDFFWAGVLPPLLMAALVITVVILRPSATDAASLGFAQGVINDLAEHALALAIGYALTLAVLAIRHRFVTRIAQNRSGSPAPTLTTSGAPEEKSTTVVGNEPHSPQSSTASI